MNFKEEYKRDFDNVRLEDEFKNNLARKMNQAKPAKRNLRVYVCALAAVAMLAVVIGVSHLQNANVGKNVGIKTENTTTATSGTGLFATEKWYGDASTDEEIYEAFVELLQSNTLKKLYCSEDETFGDEDVIDSKAAEVILKRLVDVSAVADKMAGKIQNYMAVFEGGEIVKFQISDTGLVKLNNANTIFKIEK